MSQCDAQTLSSTYARAHRCLKSSGLKRHGKNTLCTHHRAMRDRKRALDSGRRKA